MKRQDYIIFFALIALLFAWPNIYRTFFSEDAPPPAEQSAGETAAEPSESTVAPADEVVMDEVQAAKPAEVVPAAENAEPEPAEPLTEAQITVLSSGQAELQVSSHGASIVGVTLNNYREALPEDSDPISFDFGSMPALAYNGIPGLSGRSDFEIVATPDEATVVLARAGEDGLTLLREIRMETNFLVVVSDTFENTSGRAVTIGKHEMQLGELAQEKGVEEAVGVINMGVDALPPAESVKNYGKQIPKRFKQERENEGLSALPETITWRVASPAEWVAAKNKYFVQILKPDGAGADWFEIFARRKITPEERAGKRVKTALLESVSVSAGFDSQVLPAGESYTRTFEYYVGPKSFKILSGLSHGREGAMGFEENAYMDFIVVPAAKILIRLLDWIHDHVFGNYGVAIILLTLIVRIIFWPITHKGTESMRRMSSVQPLMAEIREKYKDNPQKMQQAMMALYKEHKINPLGGCLPMLVQIPVFFALFVVLRIAIELRFADFLWINDLSAPERLVEFGFTIPLLGWDALNILPLLMTATMIIQQKMTPTAGDPQQQKMMMIMMPAMMLFFLYNFASGLALYWTTQNFLMIVQQFVYLQRKKRQEASA